jgi:hypothetical protein
MYAAFVIGWEKRYKKQETITKYFFHLNIKKIRIISFSYLIFGLLTIILYYKNITTYISRIFVLSVDDEFYFKKQTTLLEIFSNLAIYFLPFAVFGFLSLIEIKNRSKIIKILILIVSIIFVLIFSLNSNRQNMIYPVLALLAGFSGFIKFKPLPSVFVGIVALYFLFVFGNIRAKDQFDLEDSSKDTREIVNDIQIYAGGSQMIAPIYKMNEKKFTIFNSFISSFPVLGTPFRENSGVKLYNYLFYGYIGPQDQIFLTQAECYTNGGYLLIIVFFLIVGYYYAYLNKLFIYNLDSQFLFRVSLFYLVLLFNATILLSFQVMGQFLFYNAMPALLIMFYYRKVNKLTRS